MKLHYLALAAMLLSTAAVAQTSILTEVQRIEGEAQVQKAGHLEKPSDLGVMAAVWTAEAWQGWRGCAFWGDFHVAGAVG